MTAKSPPISTSNLILPAAKKIRRTSGTNQLIESSRINVIKLTGDASLLATAKAKAGTAQLVKKALRKSAADKAKTPAPQFHAQPKLANQPCPAASSLSVAKGKLLAKSAVENDNTMIKVKKSKLVRDSFTIPDHEYKLLQILKERAVTAGLPLKKSELLRAGILQLMALHDVEFLQALRRVDIIKTGRPAKAK